MTCFDWYLSQYVENMFASLLFSLSQQEITPYHAYDAYSGSFHGAGYKMLEEIFQTKPVTHIIKTIPVFLGLWLEIYHRSWGKCNLFSKIKVGQRHSLQNTSHTLSHDKRWAIYVNVGKYLTHQYSYICSIANIYTCCYWSKPNAWLGVIGICRSTCKIRLLACCFHVVIGEWRHKMH